MISSVVSANKSASMVLTFFSVMAAYKATPLQDFRTKAEPYSNAPANFSAGPHAARDESTMTWKENFGAWWTYWSESMPENRDWALLDRIHPNRIKSLKEWMETVGYDGMPSNLLKGVEDLRKAMQAMQEGAKS